MYEGIQIIAEVKTKSPFGFVAKERWEELFKLADKIGDIISIHTDPRWEGTFELLKKARKLTKKPLLAKGIHEKDEDIIKAIEFGADFVLVVGRIPFNLPLEYKNKCWIEPYTLAELKNIPAEYKVLWNSRDLKNGEEKKETFEQARQIRKGWMCQASNIRTVADIKRGADAVLVGTYLMQFAQSIELLS